VQCSSASANEGHRQNVTQHRFEPGTSFSKVRQFDIPSRISARNEFEGG
jgi:hypothetical protein